MHLRRLTSSKLDALEQQVSSVTTDKSFNTIFGIVCPEQGHLYNLEYTPNGWVKCDSRPHVFIASKLEPILKTNKRFVVVIGGRGSGKSVQLIDIAMAGVKDLGDKVYCLREFQNSLEDSVHSLITSEYDRLGMTGFSTQNNAIHHEGGGSFKFKGLARNPASIKSAAGFRRFLIEEAQTISAESLKELTPTARNKAKAGLPQRFLVDTDEEENAEIDHLNKVQLIFIGNPGSSADPFSQRFIEPFRKQLERDGFYEDELHLIIVMNYSDNPWFDDSGLEGERIFDHSNLPRALYDHIWLGQYNDSVDNAIIASEWFDACIDAHKKLNFKTRGSKVLSFDPSDTGPDAKGYALRHGVVFEDVGEIDQPDINTALDAAADMAITNAVDMFTWDCDGMGVGLKREVDNWLAPKKIQTKQFRGSASPDNNKQIYEPVHDQQQQKTKGEIYKNKRAKNNWLLRDRCYLTYRAVVHGEYSDPDNLISFSSSIKLLQMLRSELCRIPKKPNGAGMIQIMSKEDMRKLGIKSPNMADSVMMALDNPVSNDTFTESLEFNSLW
jgi:phage terminase large subunit